jgi:arginase
VIQRPTHFKAKHADDSLSAYLPRQGHDELKAMAIHVPTGHGALRAGEGVTVDGGQYVVRERLESVFANSGSTLEEDVVPVDEILSELGEERSEPEKGVRNAPQIVAIGKETAKRVGDAVDKGYFPIIMGGDHSTMVMGFPEMLDRYPDPDDPEYSSLKLVFIDAHPDILQDPGEDVGNAHGRTISTLLGKGPKDLMPTMEGRRKLRPENILYVGISKPDEDERDFIRDEKIQCWDLDKMRRDPQGFYKAVQEFLTVERDGQQFATPFFAEFDPDVLCKRDSKGTPMTSDEGMERKELYSLGRLLSAQGDLVGMGTAEVAPKLDVDGGTAESVSGFMARALGKGDPEYYHEYDPHAETGGPAEVTVVGRQRSRWLRKLSGVAAGLAAGVGGLIVGHQASQHNKPTVAVVRPHDDEAKTSTPVLQARADFLGQFSRSGFRETAARLRMAADLGDQNGVEDALDDLVRTYTTAANATPNDGTESDLGRLTLSEFVGGFGWDGDLDSYYQQFLSKKREHA